MAKFRKKPVEVEARQWDGSAEGATPIIDWILACGHTARYVGPDAAGFDTAIRIDTLEGTMTTSPNDYVIKGVQGEFYPCKPEIFEATYEPVVESDTEVVYLEESADPIAVREVKYWEQMNIDD